MKTYECTTQAQLDEAIAKAKPKDDLIVLVGNGTFSFSGSSSPRVEARDSSSPRVVARGSSSPTVVAWDSSSPTVEAWDSSSPTVEAWESSSPTVVARDSSSPRGSATKYAPVTVHRYDTATVNITGAVVIEPPVLDSPQAWCEYLGVTVRRGKVVLYKAVDDAHHSGRGFAYPIGSTVEAPDWTTAPSCGGGLHLGPHPRMTRDYFFGATRFLACEVRLADLVPILDGGSPKAKVRKCKVLYEVDEWSAEPLAVSA